MSLTFQCKLQCAFTLGASSVGPFKLTYFIELANLVINSIIKLALDFSLSFNVLLHSTKVF